MRIGFVGASYTARSTTIADEECINFFAESVESQGAVVPSKSYGGQAAQGIRGLLSTPGIVTFAALPEMPVRGSIDVNGRIFTVGGSKLVEVFADGTQTVQGTIANDATAVSIAFNSIQILIVSAGSAYCFTLATNTLLDVTAQLAGVPIQVDGGDTYFIVIFKNSNKFQMSQVLDGTTWPGLLVNEVTVFPENIASIKVNHRELWIFGFKHCQVYQDTGSAEVYDVIPGALIEKGSGATFSPSLLDNSIFWIDKDDRGGRTAWRSNGYTPQRVSTHAVETDLATYASIAGLVSYSYQDGGHLFWVLYIPGSKWSWVFDVGENLWHKRAKWINGTYQAHWGWNHVYAFGKHLIGDWNSAKLYDMNLAYLSDDGATIRRLRRPPTVINELDRVFHAELRVNFDTGQGPQPPLTDGDGNPRPPQAMLRWSNDAGKTWSNEHWRGCGFSGEFGTFVRWQRLGYGRRRVYELVVTDPIPWVIEDAYLRTA